MLYFLRKTFLLVLILSFSVLMFSCTGDKDEVEKIMENAFAAKDNLEEELPSIKEKTQSELLITANDSLGTSLKNAYSYFEGTYIAQDAVWNFNNDGSMVVVDSSNVVYNYSYTLMYAGADSTNKFIEFNYGETKKKYRFKRQSINEFEVVFISDDGNDGSTFVFVKDNLRRALDNKSTFFEASYSSKGSVWNFKNDGTIILYSPNGEILTYSYILEYVDKENLTENYLVLNINNNIDRLKITATNALDFEAIYVSINGVEGEAIKFVKEK